MMKKIKVSVFIRKKKMKKTNINRYYIDIRYSGGERYNRTLNVFADKDDNRKTKKFLEKLRKEVYIRLSNGENIDEVLSYLEQNTNKHNKRQIKVLTYINNLSKKINIPDYEIIISTLKKFAIENLKHPLNFSFDIIDTEFIAKYRLYLALMFESSQADYLVQVFLNILNYACRDNKINFDLGWENLL